jgi:O-antigen ligase
MEYKFIKAFCFFGPLGNLIPIFPQISSFRFFYLIASIGIVYFIYNLKRNNNAICQIKYFIPIYIYMLISCMIYVSYHMDTLYKSENPIFRFILLSILFLFTVFSGNIIYNLSIKERLYIINVYIKGYLISLICGYIIFIGYYMGLISFDLIKKIEVLPQLGYGLLRFAPGSYANEYGIVSSFMLSIITILILNKNIRTSLNYKILNKIFSLLIIYILIIIALFLTTTRTAYISYIVSLMYVLIYNYNIKRFLSNFFKIMLIFIVIFSIVQIYIYDIWNILITGYIGLFDKDASAYARISELESLKNYFLDNLILGTGFGSVSGMHNLYMQFLFELGLIGVCILIIIFMIIIYLVIYTKREKINNSFIKLISNIGLIHILWFALSNHNLNHHLTWFVILLCYMRFGKLRGINI